jgi:hypothetical protein
MIKSLYLRVDARTIHLDITIYKPIPVEEVEILLPFPEILAKSQTSVPQNVERKEKLETS